MDPLEQFIEVALRALEDAGRGLSEAELRAQINEEAIRRAFQAPFASIDGELLYPAAPEQAAILAARIIESVDLPGGLERSAALLFADIRLQYADLELLAPASEIETVFVAISDGRVSDDVLIRWFMRRVRPLRTHS